MQIYKRQCPECEKEICYDSQKGFKKACTLNLPCQKCRYELMKKNYSSSRKCPKCNEDIIYHDKYTFNKAAKNNTLCFSCGRKSEKNISAIVERNKTNIRSGEDASMFGKTAKGQWIEKYGLKEAERLECECNNKKSVANSGNKNPMFGKTVKNVWIKKYGLEQAEKLDIEYRKKQSINSSGENNPMFGKPSPIGSGNGWSGWYKGDFFRSLLELSFMFEHDGRYKTCESKDFKIEYFIDGVKRNYFPDFVVDNIVYEIKPKKLWSSYQNNIKTNAAIEWCGNNNYVYEIFEPIKLDKEKIKELVDSEIVKLTDRYNIKFNYYA